MSRRFARPDVPPPASASPGGWAPPTDTPAAAAPGGWAHSISGVRRRQTRLPASPVPRPVPSGLCHTWWPLIPAAVAPRSTQHHQNSGEFSLENPLPKPNPTRSGLLFFPFTPHPARSKKFKLLAWARLGPYKNRCHTTIMDFVKYS